VAEVAEGQDDSTGPASSEGAALLRERHRVVGKVADDIERFQFNTALSAMMELLNAATEYHRKVTDDVRDGELEREVAEVLTLLLAPYVPHMAEELWREVLRHEGSVHRVEWPTWDPEKAAADEVEVAVQVNGKVRARLTVEADADEETVRAAALALPKVIENVEGKTVRKVVVVPGKLVSIVVS